ncbi:MAG TPA: BadF/BadG/BcrA/BcrD ATPase family protein [Solirubrobacteraceae bacterium]|nr:BadF/BadG/BcrA/BcrD ATPase family protein [Solirubrobacteraceae bacterium]
MKRESLVKLPRGLIASGPGTDGSGGRLATSASGGGDGLGFSQDSLGTRFVMGVDGGATKTLAAVLDLRKQTLHLGHGGSSNQDAVGAHAATDSLVKATDEAIGRAGIEREQLDAAVLAIAGTDTDAVATHVRERCPAAWLVVNDVVGAWAAATDARPGVGVISGTGSNVFGIGSDGRAWRAGGWGHVLGDEGSGYWLAVQSIKAVLADREASGPQTALSAAAIEFFDVQSVEALATLVYAKPLSKGEIAAFAIETARVAYAGDEVARSLYMRAAEELARQIAAVVEQTALRDEFPIGLIGSAFKAGELFVAPLAAAIHEFAPQAQVAVVETSPVGGCVLLAALGAGRRESVDAAELKQLLDAALAQESLFRE